MADLSNKVSDMENFEEKIDLFIQQYELDMRGDKDLSNGNRGVIGELREIKKTLKEHPSLTWLIAHRPVPTFAIVFTIYLIFEMITTYAPPLLQGLLGLAGVRLP